MLAWRTKRLSDPAELDQSPCQVTRVESEWLTGSPNGLSKAEYPVQVRGSRPEQVDVDSQFESKSLILAKYLRVTSVKLYNFLKILIFYFKLF